MFYYQLLNICSIRSMIICEQRLYMLLIKMVYFSCKVVLLSPEVCSRCISDTKRCKAIKGLLRFVSNVVTISTVLSYLKLCHLLSFSCKKVHIFSLTVIWRTTVGIRRSVISKQDHIFLMKLSTLQDIFSCLF